MRGETPVGQERPGYLPISIHSPHARGDKCFHDPLIGRPISIHSPHARGDNSAAFIRNSALISIHSPHARGDLPFRYMSSGFKISIHSPHARGDQIPRSTPSELTYFNPLPSCEGRPGSSAQIQLMQKFQSTPLMRGETISPHIIALVVLISIHSSHARGDDEIIDGLRDAHISIHSPHARGDSSFSVSGVRITISIHSPHARGDNSMPSSV